MITTKSFEGETVEGVLTTFGTRTQYNVRIMSDVWADITYAQYLTADGEVRETAVYNSEFPGNGSTCVEDATPEVKLAAEAVLAARTLADKAREAAHVAQLARTALADVTVKGRTVKVTAKRAKGFGNEGVVFWSGAGEWGTRLGMKLTGTGETFWTAAKNCAVTGGVDASEADELAANAFEADKAAKEAHEVARANAVKAVAGTLEVAPF